MFISILLENSARPADDGYAEAVYNYFNENEDGIYGEDENAEV